MMDTVAIITLKLSMLTSGTAGRTTYLIRIILAIIVTITLPCLLYAPSILTGELCWTTSFVSCKWERIKLVSRNFFSNDMRRHNEKEKKPSISVLLFLFLKQVRGLRLLVTPTLLVPLISQSNKFSKQCLLPFNSKVKKIGIPLYPTWFPYASWACTIE